MINQIMINICILIINTMCMLSIYDNIYKNSGNLTNYIEIIVTTTLNT